MNCISSNEEERRYSSWILDRKACGTVVRLYKGLNTIGRHSSSNVRVLGYHYVSRHHAIIFIEPYEEKIITLRDVGSLNGVYVNNKLYSVGVQLKAGDLIGIGAEYIDDPFEDKELPIYELRYEPIFTSRSRRPASNDNTYGNGGDMCGMCIKRENESNENADVIVLISDDEDDNGNRIE